MKVLILAGGFAKRMGECCRDIPKSLLPIAGKPVIEHILEKLESIKGIGSVCISTNKRFEEHFIQWMKGLKTPIKISLLVEPAMEEGKKLGSVGAFQFFLEQKKVKDDVLIINGDNVFTFELDKFVSFTRGKDALVLTAYDTGDLSVAAKLGVLGVDGSGRVVEFEEKPANPKSTLVSPGIYFYPRTILPKVKEYIEEGNNPDTIGFFHQWLHGRHPVMAHVYHEGKWFDIGTPETYELAERELSDA